MPKTMRDIALELGVTITTVSRALNGKPDVSNETRDRVLATAERLGYIHSALGRGLAAGYINAVGCIVTSVTDPFAASILEGVDAAAQSAGLAVLIATSHGDPDQELFAVSTLRSFRVAGIISTSSYLTIPHLERLRQTNSPIVLINTEAAELIAGSIQIDNVAAAQRAVEYLYQLGHHRIAHIACNDESASSVARHRGYRDALKERGLLYDPDLVIASDDSVQGGAQATAALMDRDAAPTAIFCYNDRIAIGALSALRLSGISVPADISVIGIDDIEMATWVTPSLTTIRQSSHAMGAAAMNMLLQMRSGTADATDIVIPSELIERESTAPR